MTQVIAGLPNREIALAMERTLKSVESYRARVMRKMQARNLPELVRMSVVLDYGVDVLSRAGPPAAARTGHNARASSFVPDDPVHRSGRIGRTPS